MDRGPRVRLRAVWILVVIMRLIGAAEPASGTDSEWSRATLAGIRGFYVTVDLNNKLLEASHGMLDSTQVRSDVELKLRSAGIRVLSESEWLKTAGMPGLGVAVDALKQGDDPIYTYSIHVMVSQEVSLDRKPLVSEWTETWSTGSLGIAGSDNVPKIRDFIKDQVDQFLNAYLAANPKSPRTR
jgi:hypothetical protein